MICPICKRETPEREIVCYRRCEDCYIAAPDSSRNYKSCVSKAEVEEAKRLMDSLRTKPKKG